MKLLGGMPQSPSNQLEHHHKKTQMKRKANLIAL